MARETRSFIVEAFGETASAIDQMAKITDRTSKQVIFDALDKYKWVLERQTSGENIIATGENPQDTTKLVNLIVDKEKAQAYFKKGTA